MPEDRLILDRDVPQEMDRLGIGNNPIDVAEIENFTLEAELARLSGLVREDKVHGDEEIEIKKRMKQAEEDKGKLSERGIAAFNYLESRKEIWNR